MLSTHCHDMLLNVLDLPQIGIFICIGRASSPKPCLGNMARHRTCRERLAVDLAPVEWMRRNVL